VTTSRLQVTGHYAGAVSRAAGAALDIAIVLGSFTIGLALANLLWQAVIGESLTDDGSGLGSVVALAAWAFLYMFLSLAIAGRTPGKGIVGLRVVQADGSTLTSRGALVRTLAFPLSSLFFGLGFLGIFVQREHRALHDLIARTAVVYDWGGRDAEVPRPLSEFLTRRAGAEYASRE
jgi:uncharacterized RDD family membrane protein YckC